MSITPSRSNYLHAAIVTAIVLVFIALMKLFTLQVHFFDPFSSRLQDYEVTDILFSRLRDTAKVEMEPRIVMVHVPNPQRAEVAALINRISARNPRVIGVDILFPGRKDSVGDAALAQSLKASDRIVLAANLMDYDAASDSIPGLIVSDPLFSDNATNAYTNFVAGSNRTVRLFSPSIKTMDGDYHQAFATAIARKYDPNLANRLQRRGRNAERINYLGDYRSFIRIDGEAVLTAEEEDLRLFNDRIVLIGFANSRAANAPLEDRYFTPLNQVYTGRSNPDMYGMTIHANILAMILRGNWIYELPRWMMHLFTIGFTYLNVLVIQRIYHKLPDVFHGVTRLLQIAEAIVIFFVVTVFFSALNIKLEFGFALLAMLMAYDFVMIYENLIRKRIPYLKDLDYV